MDSKIQDALNKARYLADCSSAINPWIFRFSEHLRRQGYKIVPAHQEVTQNDIQKARKILRHLGWSVSESSEPGADRIVDQVAVMLSEVGSE